MNRRGLVAKAPHRAAWVEAHDEGVRHLRMIDILTRRKACLDQTLYDFAGRNAQNPCRLHSEPSIYAVLYKQCNCDIT